MKAMTIPFFTLLLAGCGEQIDKNYATYVDAQRAGAVEKGWIPAFIPSSASDIVDSHDLDTNRQTLQFKLPPSAIGGMVAGLRKISTNDQNALADLLDKYATGRDSEGYVVCSEVQNGALIVDAERGKAFYDTIVSWLDDDCF